MTIVVEYFLERPAINHGLVSLVTFALFSFERLDRERTKLDSLNCSPWINIAFQYLDSIKAGVLERSQKSLLGERA